MAKVAVHAETEVNPTEDEDKVKVAVRKVLGNASVKVKPEGKGKVLTAEAVGQDALIEFRNLLRTDRIRDAARKALFRSLHGDTISFCLNKQVAFAGHVSFSEENAESPQGPIRVKITSDNPRQLIEWLAEKTA
jgi:hypothetical protein